MLKLYCIREMKVKIVLQFTVRCIVYFLFGQIWRDTFAIPFREECLKSAIFKKKQQDSSLQNHIIEIIEVGHLAFCTTACLDNVQCKSYNFQETENVVKLCELSSSNKTASSTDLIPRQGYSYYDAEDDGVPCDCLPGGTCIHYTCSETAICEYSPNCDFNSGNTCNYEKGSGQFYWTVRQGSTPSTATGPSSDVSGGGYYLYTEATSRYYGDKATILTPYLSGPQCMKFSYHMYGGTMGVLSIYANDHKVFTKSGNQGNLWVGVEVPIQQSGKYKVKFEGVRGSSYESDIAIDAISFTPGHC